MTGVNDNCMHPRADASRVFLSWYQLMRERCLSDWKVRECKNHIGERQIKDLWRNEAWAPLVQRRQWQSWNKLLERVYYLFLFFFSFSFFSEVYQLLPDKDNKHLSHLSRSDLCSPLPCVGAPADIVSGFVLWERMLSKVVWWFFLLVRPVAMEMSYIWDAHC